MELLTLKNTTPFIPPITTGKVIKVYDGDTITIGTILYGNPHRFSVRLNRIDTPELNHPLGPPARTALADRILDKIVVLRNVSYDKYGRLLADVDVDGDCINDWLLSESFAQPYSGGKKPTW